MPLHPDRPWQPGSPDAWPTPPPGTQPLLCHPDHVRVGDFLLVDRRYLRIEDLRGRGGYTGRVLMLGGYGPWVMTTSRQVHRPVTSDDTDVR
ncbi:hypothetical protein ABT160_15870 [Streptomyces sp. NPDC001941]|uniref:hypothetical protein n=1 Tax=Streptomyces sp. NPDC001941 TaxID=3154659 RepID=UPI00331E9F5E